MDNDSQKIEEKEADIQEMSAESSADIQFDDVFNMNEVQKQLENELPKDVDFNSSSMDRVNEALESAIAASPLAQYSPTVTQDSSTKKYVIYVESDNVDYMENLSANERKEVVNKILRDQNKLSEKERNFRQKIRFVSHLTLSVLTFIICFPLLFVLVNKAAKISIENYTNAKTNISKLYKEQGKIKIK